MTTAEVDTTDLYSDLCDAAFRELHPEWDEKDGLSHTSPDARKLALRIMGVLEDYGLIPEDWVRA